MYESKGPQSAALYGREMSKSEAHGILHEVSILSEKIDRMLAGKECPGLTGDKGQGDLPAYWTSLFNRDLDQVLFEVAKAHYNLESDAKSAAEMWVYTLHQRTRELLTYGMMQDFDFLARAEKALPAFSTPTEIHHPLEPSLEVKHAVRRLALLESLFLNHPNPNSPMQSAFVTVEPHGVVTLQRYKILQPGSQFDEYRLGIGINTSNVSWDSAGFSFDREGKVSPLYLTSPIGNIAKLRLGFTPPTADSLCRDVMEAFLRDQNALTFTPPKEPNRRWFVDPANS